MRTTQQVTGRIITRGRQIVIILQKQQKSNQRNGRRSLTRRQQDILELMAQGLPNKIIACRLHSKINTIKKQCQSIFLQFGVTNRVQAVLQWQEMSGYKFEFPSISTGNDYQVLSKRENQVARLIAEGDMSKVIADKLGLADGTVKKYTLHVFNKLRVNNRMQIAQLYNKSERDNGQL